MKNDYTTLTQAPGKGSAVKIIRPDNKVHGANMGPIWDRQDPGWTHIGPMNFVIWVSLANVSRLHWYQNNNET